jgi:uncharacterized membrane protein
MDFALFTFPGIGFALKWLHFFFGILWIGHLYYFNFTQGAAIGQVEPANIRPNVLSKFLPVAMWWFRWGAMWTLVTGLLMLHFTNFPINSDWGVKILTGGVFGILMWANVWFIIWPAQKIAIQSNTQVAGGGQALPAAAAMGAKALLASRTNTLFSIPMLFYMGAASHLPMQIDTSKQLTWWVVFAVLAGGLEFNAIKGQLGPMKTVKGVITSGFVLTAVVYLLMEVIL